MIKYNKLFGSIRILLGLLYLAYPGYEYFSHPGSAPEDQTRWLFVFLFFLLYSWSAIQNGILELSGRMPKFNLPRFFEASMNGFLFIYLAILTIVSPINETARIMLGFLAFITLLTMIRDMRIISLQYIERKNKKRSK